jgi:hypothetical protein
VARGRYEGPPPTLGQRLVWVGIIAFLLFLSCIPGASGK